MKKILLLVCLPLLGFGQKKFLNHANHLFEQGQYEEALKWYNQYDKILENKKALVKRGITNYYTNNLEASINDMKGAFLLKSKDNKVFLYTGKSYHALGKYEDAATFYKNYLNTLENKADHYPIINLIKQCESAQNIQYKDKKAFVENLGPGLNTSYNETRPKQSPSDINKYYFSSDRNVSTGGLQIIGDKQKYFSDIYSVLNNEGNWNLVDKLYERINSVESEELQGFSPDGQIIYFSRGREGKSRMLLSDTLGNENPIISEIFSPVIFELGDRDFSQLNDSTYIFSSKRKGGFGGYDLYYVVKTQNQWLKPVNLGKEINSPYNEIASCITKNGNRLFFSSDRLLSIGGYDIFQSNYTDNAWSIPENMGLPINSVNDDLHINISSDGNTAIFSSNRPEGEGGHDLYIAYFKEQIIDQLQYLNNPLFIGQQTNIADARSIPENIGTEERPIIEREFFNKALYYQNDSDILGPQNLTRLNLITDLLRVYPEYDIIITGHTSKEGLPEFDLYFSIKRVEQIAKYLVDNGVKASSIFLRGCGSMYPVSQPIINGQESRISEKLNNRIDLSLKVAEEYGLKVIDEEIPVALQNADERYMYYENYIEGLSYKILVTKSPQMYKNEILKSEKGSSLEKSYGDTQYSYYVGIYNSYKEAKRGINKISQIDYPGIRIVAFIDGKPVEDEELSKHINDYPDIEDFMLYELGK